MCVKLGLAGRVFYKEYERIQIIYNYLFMLQKVRKARLLQDQRSQ